jgi:O-methyltransferase/8-demethyl-8-(2,3-dimethoxy-alpha-L-rhamnosyl)tetracenomycin-C 4'-O-methyltransferase
LDKVHPHITIIQRFVRTSDLNKVYATTDKISHTGLRLTTRRPQLSHLGQFDRAHKENCYSSCSTRCEEAEVVMRNHLYLDLMKRSLNNYLHLGKDENYDSFSPAQGGRYRNGEWVLPRSSQPHTLLFEAQLDLIERAILALTRVGIRGDFLEAGVWRGGAVIYMAAVIEAYGIKNRVVFGADSFNGIPVCNDFGKDAVNEWPDRWVASAYEVRGNIARYGLADDRIALLEGGFDHCLQTPSINTLALIRLDADSYSSTRTALELLYPKLSDGGIVIIDDWHLPGCRLAVEEFRSSSDIESPIIHDPGNEYWVKGYNDRTNTRT